LNKMSRQNLSQNYFPLFWREGKVSCNVLWSGRVFAPKSDRAIVAFNNHIRRDPRLECVMLPVRGGITVLCMRS